MSFRAHIEAIKSEESLKGARIMFFGERNVGHEIGHFQRVLAEYEMTYTYKQRADRDYGIWTDDGMKMAYAMAAQREMAKGCVHYYKNMVCSNRELDANTRKEVTIRDFQEQASRYRLVSSAPRTAHSTAKVTVSGKVGKDGRLNNNFNDDLFFAFTGALGVHDLLVTKRLENMDYSLVPAP